MKNTKIEWTERTWNPVVGCDKISAGCKNCYAINMANRLQGIKHSKEKYAGTVERTAGGALNWTGKINLSESSLIEPLKIKTPTMFFVNSMSDLFHDDVPFDFIQKVFTIMAVCPQHTFQILTKRPARMKQFFDECGQYGGVLDKPHEILWQYFNEIHEFENHPEAGKLLTGLLPALKQAGWFWDTTYSEDGKDSELVFDHEGPLRNVWLGVSVEDQKAADERIDILLSTPATIRFLSCEPLIGPVDLKLELPDNWAPLGLHWVIAGGESGNGARPMRPEWARSLRDQCISVNIPFFFKQWGEYHPDASEEWYSEQKPLWYLEESGEWSWFAGDSDTTINCSENFTGKGQAFEKAGKKKAGRLLDGREWNEMPIQEPKPFL